MNYEDEIDRMRAQRGKRRRDTVERGDQNAGRRYSYSEDDDFEEVEMGEDDNYGPPDDFDWSNNPYIDYDENKKSKNARKQGFYMPSDSQEPYDHQHQYRQEMNQRESRNNQRTQSQSRQSVQMISNSGDRRQRTQKDQDIRQGRNYDRGMDMRRHRQADKKRKKKKRRLAVLGVILILFAIIGTYFFLGTRTNKEGYWTIAIFGVDSRDGSLEKNTLSDVEIICNINKATGEIQLVSVFRDTYLKIDSKGTYHKINEAYFKGGHKQALEVLNENLDLKIDDYATFNWKSVAEAINILGGIDLEITDAEFKYINSFITFTVEATGIGSHHLKSPGMQHLDGVQAVAYARLRLMDTDFNRTERQRKVISLAMDKAKQADFSVLNNILVTVLPQINTSIGLSDLLPMAKGINKYHIGESTGFPFSRTPKMIGKKDCVIPTTLESNVVQLHQLLYKDMEYKVPSSVKKISEQIAKDSGLGEVGENAKNPGTGNSSGGKKPSEPKAPPAESSTEVTITVPPETEMSTEAVTAEVTTDASKETSSEHPTNEDGSLIGPGAGLPKETTKAAEIEPTKKEETKTTAAQETTKPSETSKAAQPPQIQEPSVQIPEQNGPGADVGPGI